MVFAFEWNVYTGLAESPDFLEERLDFLAKLFFMRMAVSNP